MGNKDDESIMGLEQPQLLAGKPPEDSILLGELRLAADGEGFFTVVAGPQDDEAANLLVRGMAALLAQAIREMVESGHTCGHPDHVLKTIVMGTTELLAGDIVLAKMKLGGSKH